MTNRAWGALADRAASRAQRRQGRARLKAARKEAWAKLRRGVFWPLRSCPTPGVESFRDISQADVACSAINRKSRSGAFSYPSECQCGYWHIRVLPAEAEWEE